MIATKARSGVVVAKSAPLTRSEVETLAKLDAILNPELSRTQKASAGLRLLGSAVTPSFRFPQLSLPNVRFDRKVVAETVSFAVMATMTAVIAFGVLLNPINLGSILKDAPATVAKASGMHREVTVIPARPPLPIEKGGPAAPKAALPAVKLAAKPAGKLATDAVKAPAATTQHAAATKTATAVKALPATKLDASPSAMTHKSPALAPQSASAPQPKAANHTAPVSHHARSTSRSAPKATPAPAPAPPPVVNAPKVPIAKTPPPPTKVVVKTPAKVPPVVVTTPPAPKTPESTFVDSSGGGGNRVGSVIDLQVGNGYADAGKTPDGNSSNGVSNPGATTVN